MIRNHDPYDSIAALSSESLTTESFYLLQKFIRQLGSNNIDYRLRQGNLEHSVYNSTGFDCTLQDIESKDLILLIGSNLRKEIPLVNHRVHKAVKNNNAQVLVFNSYHYNFNYPVDTLLVNSNELVDAFPEPADAAWVDANGNRAAKGTAAELRHFRPH